jgi:ATP-dependent Clp protease protease subunit
LIRSCRRWHSVDVDQILVEALRLPRPRVQSRPFIEVRFVFCNGRDKRVTRTQIKLPTSQRPSGQKQRLFARSTGAGFDVRAAGNATVIEFYDEVGAYGISAKAFSEKLKTATGNVVLKINSPGGDVFDGVTIHNDIIAHRGKVRVEITGLAASAASIIAMAGDEIAIAENAFVMIHDSWGLTIGNRHDHSETEDLLAQIDQALAATYAARTGLSVADCAGMMDDETWLAGADAKAKGFADEILGSADVVARFDLSLYAHAPAGLSHRAEGAANLNSPVELEKLLRSAGLSRRQAKAVSFSGWSGLTGSSETSEIANLSARVAAASASLERKLR